MYVCVFVWHCTSHACAQYVETVVEMADKRLVCGVPIHKQKRLQLKQLWPGQPTRKEELLKSKCTESDCCFFFN